MENRIVVGADEAGYGPNLGPLLIVATAWSIRPTWTTTSFRRHFSELSRLNIGRPAATMFPSVTRSSFINLQSVSRHSKPVCWQWSMIWMREHPETSLTIFQLSKDWSNGHQSAIDGDSEDSCDEAPWYKELDHFQVPIFHQVEEIARLAELARTALSSPLNQTDWLPSSDRYGIAIQLFGRCKRFERSVTFSDNVESRSIVLR